MPEIKSILSVDLGGSKIIVGIVDSGGHVVDHLKKDLPYPTSQEVLWDIIVSLCNNILDRNKQCKVCCAGVAIPGLADPENGMWVYSSFSGIKDMPFTDIFYDKLGMKCYIENDVNACALGEMHFGACKNTKDFIWVTISNGIGGSVVTDGKLLAGANKSAGEFGHICVDENGPICKCGKQGCLEACAAGPAILRRYIKLIGNDPETNESLVLNAEVIANKAKNGDAAAIQVYEETGYYLGKAISTAVNILNPEKIIFGGGVSASMDLFYPKLKETLDKMVFKQANPDIRIKQTALGYNAALCGAAAVALQRR